MLWLALALLLMLLAVSHDSLWIDEGNTAVYAIQPTYSAWKAHLLTDHYSDCQFPLYMYLVWAWGHVAGTSEFALRALNLPFAVIACIMFFLLARTLRVRWLAFALLIQPFFWFYLNEARPYMLQIATGSMVAAGFSMIVIRQRERLGWALFLSGTVLLFYSTLLCFVSLSFFFIVLIFEIWRGRAKLPSRWLLLLAGLIAVLTPGALYYLQTVLRGAGGAKIWAISPLNWLWVAYETVGAVGLGPPVREIRDIAHEVLANGFSLTAAQPFVWPLLYGLVTCLVAAMGLARIWKTREAIREVSLFVFLFGSVVIVFGVLSVLLHKAFWARHLAPIFPVYVICFTYVLSSIWGRATQRSMSQRTLVAVCLGMMIASCVSLTFSPAHRKDDNRAAAQIAKESLHRGECVWWAGSWECAAYYGLSALNGESYDKNLVLPASSRPDNMDGLARPAVIILSRPDIYDSVHAIRDLVGAGGFMPVKAPPHAFQVWKQADIDVSQ